MDSLSAVSASSPFETLDQYSSSPTLFSSPLQEIATATIVNVSQPIELVNCTDNHNKSFIPEALSPFVESYRSMHGELSLSICLFGFIANVLNIIVLSRKNMSSPTNFILRAIAYSDLVVIIVYIPYVIHYFMRQADVPGEELFSYGWAVYTLGRAHLTVTFHTISLWLTVLLAVWRYVAVRSPTTTATRSSYSMARAKAAIASMYLLVPFFCVPVYLTFAIYPFACYNRPTVTLYQVDMIHLDTHSQTLLEKVNFWDFSIMLKFTPCLLLTVLSLALIRILIDARKRKERLLSGDTYPQKRRNPSSEPKSKQNAVLFQPTSKQSQSQVFREVSAKIVETTSIRKSDNQTETSHLKIYSFCFRCFCGCCSIGCLPQSKGEIKLKIRPRPRHRTTSRVQCTASSASDRTTRMLLVILLVFLVCELPSGILALLSGIMGKAFFKNVYNYFGDLMDMLGLINSAVNFVLYCIMSAQFRKTFSQLFCIRWTEQETTNVLPQNEPRTGTANNWGNISPQPDNPEGTIETEIIASAHQVNVIPLVGMSPTPMSAKLDSDPSLNLKTEFNSTNHDDVELVVTFEKDDAHPKRTIREITLNENVKIETIGEVRKENWL